MSSAPRFRTDLICQRCSSALRHYGTSSEDRDNCMVFLDISVNWKLTLHLSTSPECVGSDQFEVDGSTPYCRHLKEDSSGTIYSAGYTLRTVQGDSTDVSVETTNLQWRVNKLIPFSRRTVRSTTSLIWMAARSTTCSRLRRAGWTFRRRSKAIWSASEESQDDEGRCRW
jgi:hypothetical protein